MASMMRPNMLRQAFTASPAQQSFTAALRSQVSRSQQLQSAFVRNGLPGATRVAAFHATSRRALLPPLPQVIRGTVNEPARVPDPDYAHGSYHWTFERLISAGLVPLTIAPFAAGSLNPVLDAFLAAGILVHSHIGFESIIIDYLPMWRVPGWRKVFMWGLRLGTVVVGIGLYEFETNDVGLTEGIKRIWHA